MKSSQYWDNLHELGWKRNARVIDMFQSKRLGCGIILESGVENFSHMVFGHPNENFELFHVTWMCCKGSKLEHLKRKFWKLCPYVWRTVDIMLSERYGMLSRY